MLKTGDIVRLRDYGLGERTAEVRGAPREDGKVFVRVAQAPPLETFFVFVQAADCTLVLDEARR